MLVIKARNVNDAYADALYRVKLEGVITSSRNGLVKLFDGPVVTSYARPFERVLFDPKRDANPFFHLFESIWMLGGRKDIKFLQQFNSTIGQFSDDGETLHGAYGHRWKKHFGEEDQLDRVIQELTADPSTRRCVVSMWDPYIDPAVAAAGGKDVPCNTQVYFRVRPNGHIDMTVTNRSNDMIWGCYGANAVHMSILHEYVASCVGRPVGTYYQFSNDLHVYEKHFDLITVPGDGLNPYEDLQEPQPLFCDEGLGMETQGMFDFDTNMFLGDPYNPSSYRTKWFDRTVKLMALSHAAYKTGRPEAALMLADQIESMDWRVACTEWLQRRIKPKNILDPKGDQEFLVPRAKQ